MLNQRPLRGISVNKNALNTQSTPSPPKFKALKNGPTDQPENKLADEARLILLKQQSLLEPLKPVPVAQQQQQEQPAKAQPLRVHLQPRNLITTTSNSSEQQQQQQVANNGAQNQHPSNETTASRIPRLSLRLPSLLASNGASNNGPLNLTKPSIKIDLKLEQSAKAQQSKLTGLLPLAEVADKLNGDRLKRSGDLATSGKTSSNADEIEVDSEDDIEDIDKSDSRDAIFLVCDIAKDVYDYMFALEQEQAIGADYLKDQKIFTPKVRQRLVNWCIDIHSQLKLLPETLYITIALIDRYFELVTVKQQSQVQLVAVSAMLVASKYEEIYPPDIGDLIYLTQNSYSRRDIMRTEIDILQQLNFNLGKPIPLAFLRRFSKAAHCDLKMHSIAKFLMEISLSEYECAHWRPSLLAAAALFTTIHLVHDNQTLSSSGLTFGRKALQPTCNATQYRWNKALTHYTRYNRRQLQEPAGTLCKILKKVIKSPQSYYAAKKNAANLSKWQELKSLRVDELIKSGDQAQ